MASEAPPTAPTHITRLCGLHIGCNNSAHMHCTRKKQTLDNALAGQPREVQRAAHGHRSGSRNGVTTTANQCLHGLTKRLHGVTMTIILSSTDTAAGALSST